ncbi:hypothetical protein ABZ456_29110 [Streptomyces sp. NPDC005776]|uniref:hypothetical protein n=1 Tax=Streptomyces sp. NPDC005776 TaxID=3154676 RepID=UPI0033D0625E
MTELEALRKVAAKAEELVQRWTDGEAARTYQVTELGTSLRELEVVEVTAGTWEKTHG